MADLSVDLFPSTAGPDNLREPPLADPHEGLSRHSIVAKADGAGEGGLEAPPYPIRQGHHRSSGVKPVRFAIRASMRGPISSLS
jgi:hypothetical protein